MDTETLDRIVSNSKKQLQWVGRFKKKRHLFRQLKSIDREYFIAIKGVRGVGKTVLMLQIAKETQDAVYFSADSTPVKRFSIYDIVRELSALGFKNIFIDEIHRKPEWDVDVKSIYDEHEVRLIFSGSSALDITRTTSDLSRRVVMKELRPVSLREYVNIKKGYEISPISFYDILKNRALFARKYADVKDYYTEYMQYGGTLYPKRGFREAMENSIRKVILQDMSSLRDVNIKYETDIYKLLYLIASSQPFNVNYSSIANVLEISKTMAIRIVKDMESTGLITAIFPCKKQGVNVKKEPKIYLMVPLRHLFFPEVTDSRRGAAREEFFVNHVKDVCYVKGKRGEKLPDFRFENTTIEVGGETKGRYQHADYIATDGLSCTGNRIPLFLFGFVY
ncbi:MAG: ATP-binding protein [Candidatus Aenigmarchaeota archaeon]|nr:ATP-binding protein [Candidatus Aenigmarchaeota archaeon]